MACHHCTRFLGYYTANPIENPVLITPPFTGKCKPLVCEPILCSLGCNKAYCSKECEQKAVQDYHQFLCPKTMPDPSHPIVQFEQNAIGLVRTIFCFE